MEKYKTIDFIGEGSFGRVFRGEDISTGETVALKFIPKRNKVDRELKILKGECDIQQGLFHPNIVRMIDCFETEREIVAVSEYVPVQLFTKLKETGKIPEYEVRQIACNLVSAIYYLHSLRILHRDIKPQNILLTSDGVAKLCDFGFSRKMGFDTYVLTSIKGTPLYMAPEVIKGRPYDQKVDLWSLGCILFELLTGKPPFNTTSILDLVRMIKTKNVKWPEDLSEKCSSFLQGLLQKDPNQRLGWPLILEHPWIKDGVILLTTPSDNPLTSPLSSFQQRIKDEQKMQLMLLLQVKNNSQATNQSHYQYNQMNQNHQQNIVDLNVGCETATYHIDTNSDCPVVIDNEKMNANNSMVKVEMQQSIYDNDSDKSMESSGIVNWHNLQAGFALFFGSEEKIIEKDEWARFLDKALVEVLERNFDVFLQSSELSLFLSPLQSKSCPIVVAEKVISLFRMPFALVDNIDELRPMIDVYIASKVLPNLIYAYINLHGDTLFEDNFDIISKIFTLVCCLVHSDNMFVSQLCDIICLLSAQQKLALILLSEISVDAKVWLISILTQILRIEPDQAVIVKEIIQKCDDIYKTFSPLMVSKKSHDRKCLCYFIGYCIAHSCIGEPYPQSFFHKMVNMKNDSDPSVRRSVQFATKSLEMFTNLFSEVCFV